MKHKVVHIIPALRQGGAEKLLFDLASRSRQAMDMTIITLLGEEPFFKPDGEVVETLGLQPGQLSLRPFSQLRARIKQLRPHVIHAWLYLGNLFTVSALGLGVPIIWSIHNTTLSRRHSGRFTRLANRVCASLSSRVPSRIVYCGPSARDVHERMGYDEGRGVVIKNGIDVAAFSFDAMARRQTRGSIGLAQENYAVGYVARFDPQKNHPLAIEAVAQICRHEQAKLVLVGRGCTADNEQLVQYLKRFAMEDHTILLGERHDMPAIMSALDVLVIASTFGEALPLAALEAAAVGLPIVAPNLGDIPALMLDPSDMVVPATAGAMATALRNVRERVSGGELEARKIERRSRIVRDFSLAKTIERYHELYRSVATLS
jgi:glycosyltransferase involved in cell wall biosynthesis